jgi:hypothetical protein
MGIEWVARFYDTEEDIIRDYVEIVQNRAAEQRSDEEGDDE